MNPLSSALYQSVKDTDMHKRRMWVWIWLQLLRNVPKSKLREMLNNIEKAATGNDNQQEIVELAFKAEVIEQLLGE